MLRTFQMTLVFDTVVINLCNIYIQLYYRQTSLYPVLQSLYWMQLILYVTSVYILLSQILILF